MMVMGPITPAATPPLSSPIEPTASRIPNKHSIASLRSVFALSICSAPAGNDKNHPASSAHCLEAAAAFDLAAHLQKNTLPQVAAKGGELPDVENSHNAKKGNLKLQTSGFDGVESHSADTAASSLTKTLHEINNELQMHCRDLHQIQLMNPSPAPSRRGSIHSLLPLASEDGPSTLPSSTQKHSHPLTADTTRYGAVPAQGQGFQSGHPLISDLGDLVNLSNANFRLLKTLQDKVNKVDLAEKMLRAEREAVERERALLKQMSAEVEKERVRLMAGGLNWENYEMNPSGTQSVLTMSRNRSGGATPDGTWDDTAEAEVFDEEWTEEKEQHLVSLEQKLKKANRQWSDEQEEILGPLERLREEKRQEAKARKLERQTSTKVERINSQEDKPEKIPRKKSSDSTGKASPRSSSFKNSFSNIRRKSSIGSIVRRDSSPSGSSQKIFKKWFP